MNSSDFNSTLMICIEVVSGFPLGVAKKFFLSYQLNLWHIVSVWHQPQCWRFNENFLSTLAKRKLLGSDVIEENETSASFQEGNIDFEELELID